MTSRTARAGNTLGDRARWTLLRPAFPAAIAMASAGLAWADDQTLALGEYLSNECVTCHRLSGQVDGIPSIVGWSPDQFVAVLRAYKIKALDNVTMQTIAGRLSEDDMTALAAYFATRKPG